MLTVEGASKSYGPPPRWLKPLVRTATDETVRALHQVDLRVGAGEVVGLIGPNGAGKSTLIKLIAGLLDPDEGTISLRGTTTVRQRQAAMGLVLADDRGLYWRLNGRQNLEFFGQLQGLDREQANLAAAAAAESVGLALDGKRVFGYSSGMKARLNLARALLHQPPLLVLDEPTRSLDPVVSEELGLLIRAQADAGRAILLSSHRLDEVAAWCDRVVALVDGTVRFDGPVDTLADDRSPSHQVLRRLLTEPTESAP
ncbi:ABC transporter ATP-binding protein [Aquihabitans sp. G128]|uniref:ABC transporter ATP-binding protein n=1 Tax=Aquihabitans sp. G128 TaxID=2849779 RepID=UPI001C230722|nr:ABC transporter ATP-binding protein [Aquihabitans sp. G128]QXC61732.1 ABC transporter ATP-binding protein [Aquihabitans sp. G128]